MKDWNNPKLEKLSVCKTKEGTVELPNNVHFCHDCGKFVSNQECNHPRNNQCTLKVHEGFYNNTWTVAHVSKCCCTGTTIGPTDPGITNS